ncbi:hypothetical protein ACOT81_13095 [Streptomyces sp. WI04-05B]|uniref:hypothetical protein n=1 Tax=Streptomyces TaxID=1883 RepID=UPI0029BB435D|nr:MULTISPECIES: hypothetical protein [unclassified Streptomyces]MDX2545377.1 hypothetical protein [Streptomyces sp. WI04-05B]MDX2588128.1 hypothetical protein [Streptomyces sp. WI04-05A]MDX3749111.1 hypothetical protein [Streptomyces sp. AK08-02]
MTVRLLHDDVSALTGRRTIGRRRIDPSAGRRFDMTMRNDFLTPTGAPYKWQELDASLDRVVVGGGVPTVVPVRYEWQHVRARTGTPKGTENWREWTFARGQSFGSTLLHTDTDGAVPPLDDAVDPPPHMDIGYPRLPKSPAVDLLLMLSWDVVAFELFCTHLTAAPELREVGGRTELGGITGSRARFRFSDPGTVAEFHHVTPVAAEHLGYGRYAGRPSAVYALSCLDCPLDVRAGTVAQRGRSSYWAKAQIDLETGDLLSADMTEMIIATLTGPDGRRVPVQKRRLVRLAVHSDAPEADFPAAAPGEYPTEVAVRVDPETLAEAIRLVERATDYLVWQISVLQTLTEGMAELALMGFRSVVGMDPVDVHRAVQPLMADLRAAADGAPGGIVALRAALPAYRRPLEGLLAFGRLAVDGAIRHAALDDSGRAHTRHQLDAVGTDLGELLVLLDLLERAGPATAPADAHES